MERVVEICCGSYEDALVSAKGGAKRIELNSALALGGLTPSLASLILTKKNTDLKVITMIRPRGAGFCYTDEEFEVMKADARLMLEHGADGLAFGFLTEGVEVDIDKTREMVEIIKSYNKEAVFHRAFDCVKDPDKALETLIELKIDRVLTSGQAAIAPEGMEMIAHLQAKYGNQIQLLEGGGMNANNALEMVEKTGISQVHSSCKNWIKDPSTIAKGVNNSFGPESHQGEYDVVDEELVRRLVNSI